MNDLPSTWAMATLGDVCSQAEVCTPATVGTFTYVDISSVDRNRKFIANPQELNGNNAPSRARKLLASGDVIVSMTRPNLNAVALVSGNHDGATASTGFEVLRPIEVEPSWILSAVRSVEFVEAMTSKVQGALYPAVKSDDVRGHQFPIPPLGEQRRITQELDTLLARVDALHARIDAVPALLRSFRTSTLSATVSGRTTAKPDPSAQVPLHPLSPLVFFKSEEGTAPGNWKWQKLVDVATLESGHTPRKSVPAYWEGGTVPWISLQDIRAADGKEIFFTKFMPTELGIENSSARLLPKGTVCFSRDISVGFVTIMGRSMATTQHFANWICGDELHPKYLMYAFIAAREHLLKSGQGSTVKTIYMPALKELRILLPPLAEQVEIVRRVEQLFAVADQLDAKVAMAKQRIDALTQSILAKAFRGELVPQDPNDEPASVLLERIRARRAAAPKPKRGRKAAEN